jgi:protein involved in polysaccharide export with SLBB domain
MARRAFLLLVAGTLAALLLPNASPLLAQGVYVYVIGEVRRPAAIKHTRGMTVWVAIAQAGGIRRAWRGNIYLTRGGETSKVDVSNNFVFPVVEPQVQPGDIIQVGERLL